MSRTKFHGFIILIMIYITTCERCLISEVKFCPDFNLLAGVQLHAFIPPDTLDTYCYRLQAALTCAFTRGRLKSCPLFYRLPFETQQGVVEIICKYRREEYFKSSQCFSKHEVKNHITTTCLPVLATSKVVSRDRCSALNGVLECARTKVLMTDGCTTADSELMVDLVQTFIQPNSKQPNSKQPSSKQPNCTTVSRTVEPQGKLALIISDITTKKYLDDATRPSQSASSTDNYHRNQDEEAPPRTDLPENQDFKQQSQESIILASSSLDLLPGDGLERVSTKSTSTQTTKPVVMTSEYVTTLLMRSSTSTVTEAEGFDGTVMGSTTSLALVQESETKTYEEKNASRFASQSNMTLQAMSLKSTQRSGNDANILHSTEPYLEMALLTIILLVFCIG